MKKREPLSTTTRLTTRGHLGKLNKAYARLEEVYRKCEQEIIWWMSREHRNENHQLFLQQTLCLHQGIKRLRVYHQRDL